VARDSQSVTESIEGGNLFAVPFNPFIGRPERLTEILDHMCEHPLWFAAPMTPEEMRENCAWYLADTAARKWEVWLGGRLVGMVLLTRITPKVDGLLHFTFFGISLFSARRLLWNLMGSIFRDFQLERISFEAPEHVKGLVAFARSKLGFRYESELSCSSHPLVAFLQSHDSGRFHAADAHTWIAKQGSRREASHWDGKKWRDVVLLRIRRTEYLERDAATLAGEAQATAQSEDAQDVVGRETSQV
jgi:hypothetical protein